MEELELYLMKMVVELNQLAGMPIEVLGFDSVPQAGDTVYVMPNEDIAKDITEKVKEQKKLENTEAVKKSSLEEMMANVSKGDMKKLQSLSKQMFKDLLKQ